MYTKPRTHLLLEDFKQFEIRDEAKSRILGGSARTNGCRQNGSESYVDYIVDNCYQYSDVHAGSSDASGWCADMVFE